MANHPAEEEENWDDDFEFGDGSPPRARHGGTVTPPNTTFGQAHSSKDAIPNTPPNPKSALKNRLSAGSFDEDWDAEDETINFKGFVASLQQQALTPKGKGTPVKAATRVASLLADTDLNWDEDDTDLARSAGVMPGPTLARSQPFAARTSPIRFPSTGATPASNLLKANIKVTPTKNKAPFPSNQHTPDTNGSKTDLDSPSDSSILPHSDTSNATTSTSNSTSFFGRLGRRLSKAGSNAGQRNIAISRSGVIPSSTLSPSTTVEATFSPSNSVFSPNSIFSPPQSFSSDAGKADESPNSAGQNPSPVKSGSRSGLGFSFGSGLGKTMLKRSGSLKQSAAAENNLKPLLPSVSTFKDLPSIPSSSRTFSKKGSSSTSISISKDGSWPSHGLGVRTASGGSENIGVATAPAEFNISRYTERLHPATGSFRGQNSARMHHVSASQSALGHGHTALGRGVMPGWGIPPSPTRDGKRKGASQSLGGKGPEVQMLTNLLPNLKREGKSSEKVNGKATVPPTSASPPEQEQDPKKQQAMPSAITQPFTSSAGNFFASIRKKSNSVQVQAQAIAEAKRSVATKDVEPVRTEEQRQDEAPDEPHHSQLESHISPVPPELNGPVQRQRRSHRRNVSAGAMITSVIDEVSSDATINNKLTAVRDCLPTLSNKKQRSGLSQSTTANEIKVMAPLLGLPLTSNSILPDANAISVDMTSSLPELPSENDMAAPRKSTSSTSTLPPVSLIEFSRSSDESSRHSGSKRRPPPFVFPQSINIRSPVSPSMGIPSPTSQEFSDSSHAGLAPPIVTPPTPQHSNSLQAQILLPPIELSPPSPPANMTVNTSSVPSVSAVFTEKDRKSALRRADQSSSTDGDDDKTPQAVPRRRVHHLQISSGAKIPITAISSTTSTQMSNFQQGDDSGSLLSASNSAPLSLSAASSMKTVAPPDTNKLEAPSGRMSPGISASLGRMAGSSTAEDLVNGGSAVGMTRRNSLTGGTTRATISSSSGSLGGLKIPAAIRMKQEALKRDLGAVREFSLSIDELKRMQFNYELVLSDVRRLCLSSGATPEARQDASPSKRLYKMRVSSPIPQFHIPRPPSMTDADLASPPVSPLSTTFQESSRRHYVPDYSPTPQADEGVSIPHERKVTTIAALSELDTHYAIWWECADLLIELGGAAPPAVAGTPVSSTSTNELRRPAFGDDQMTPKAKGRHATLPRHEPSPFTSPTPYFNGPSSSSSASLGRRGSTGQQDLNARQIQLLKGMLKTPNPNDLSSAVDNDAFFSPNQALSPVISYPGSTIRNGLDFDVPSTPMESGIPEKEKKRNRRISLVGKLGVREILAGLKWTKEKAKQRSKQSTAPPVQDPRTSIDLASDTRGSVDENHNDMESANQQPNENPAVTPTSQADATPSPYKRNRRRSLASIFKFGNLSGTEDKLASRSRSRVDLASSVTASGDEMSSRYGGSRADDSGTADADSDWDRMSSPSDIPGHSKTMKKMHSFSQESSTSGTSRGPAAPVSIPAPGIRSRRGSGTVSRTASMTRQIYNSASASAASLISSSVFGSSASQHSLHESFGGRRVGDGNDDDRRRLKKPTKSPRRPPSTSGKRSRPPSIQGSTPTRLEYPYHARRSQPPSLNRPGLHSGPHGSATDLSQPKLALTPANIIPLLVYAREVKLKLADCLIELKALETDLLLSSGMPEDSEGAVELDVQGAHW